jgi:hypothetical protein
VPAEPPTPAEAEDRMRKLLREADLAEPDSVEHYADEIILRWHEQKVAVAIDLRPEAGRAG